MKKLKAKQLLSLLLAVLMLLGSSLTVYALPDEEEEKTDSATDILTELDDSFNLLKYDKYLSKYEFDEDAEMKPVSVKIDVFDFDKEATTAKTEVKKWQGRDALIVEEEGSVSWNVNIPEAGFYNVSVVYSATTDRITDIERIFKLNGTVPYSEVRYQNFQKTWSLEYENDSRENAFKLDVTGNDLIPDRVVEYCWDQMYFRDYYGYYPDPLYVYFKEGMNTVTLEGVRDTMALAEISIEVPEKLPTYSELLEEYEAKGYKSAQGGTVFLEAEMPTSVSSSTIYPVSDRSSSITSPQDSFAIKRNSIGSGTASKAGQWIRYNFTCQESGLYSIVTRYCQNYLNGMYTSRSIKINGEFPFEEAKLLRFNFSKEWQTASLTDGNQEFLFYFEEGKTYTIEFESTLGYMADIIRRVNEIITSLNDDYMEILQLTGPEPDENRNYALSRIMPGVIADLGRQANNLYEVVEYITDMNGIKSDNTSSLEQAAILIEKMASDESEIAANFADMKTNISSLGAWLSEVSFQYVLMDYIQIQPADSELPKATDSAWQAFTFEMKKFFASFTANYNSIGSGEGEGTKTISAWTSAGRDQAQIKDNIIKNGFTKETGINVNLKLVAAGTLLPSILAKIGPDISIDATNPLDMAMRGALVPLNDFEGFDEVMERFADSAKGPLSLYGQTFAIPEVQYVPVLFVRDDILSNMGLSVPNTWDELMALVPIMQFNNMEISITVDFTPFLYQNGGDYWKDEGMATNLDDSISLDAFEYMCNMYTQYSLPVKYDAANRFKTGEMPMLIESYAFYNTLVVFAPEISGLWSFYQLPGTENKETGEVSHTCNAIITGIIMPTGCRDQESGWEFMKCYTDAPFQIDYSNEMMALLGQSGKQCVANLEAFAQLPWTTKEYRTLLQCLKDTSSITPYPGQYFIDRYISFSFQAAYNNGADPSDTLLSYISTINKEITRKRTEFKYMLESEWLAIKAYGGFEKVSDWKEYWASERGDRGDELTAMQDVRGAEYTYKDWMSEHGVSADSYSKWSAECEDGKTTLSYKDWLGK